MSMSNPFDFSVLLARGRGESGMIIAADGLYNIGPERPLTWKEFGVSYPFESSSISMTHKLYTDYQCMSPYLLTAGDQH